MLFVGIQSVAKNTDRGAPVDLLEAIQERTEVILIAGVVAHVVDSEGDDDLDAGFTNPLGGCELWKGAARVEWSGVVEVGESIGVTGINRCGGEHAEEEGVSQEQALGTVRHRDGLHC